MKKNFGIAVTFIIAALVLVIAAEAYQITGKQKLVLQGQNLDNSCTISITNTDNSSLLLSVKPVKQYFTPKNIGFSINENWLNVIKNYEWEEVKWIYPNEKTVQVAPNSKEDVEFKIATDVNVTFGTFYAQFETKDISKKEGTVVIRTVYVTQVVGEIENPNMKVIPGFGSFSLLIGILIATTFIKLKIKLFK